MVERDSIAARPLTVAVVIGSTREGRAGQRLATWFAAIADHRDDMAVDLIDLADHDFPTAHPADTTPAIDAFVARIDAADAYVVVTPEYNHGYPAALKQAIDYPYREWNAKPVGFVSYGGVGQGLRAVEQLRQVFAELHAVTVRDGVSLNIYTPDVLDSDGRPRPGDPAEQAAKTLLDQLAWWAETLRTGREARPYGTE